jgi:hypothetical protein
VLSQPFAWKFAILLAALTIALFFLIPLVTKFYGPQVADRFLERDFRYTENDFRTWATANRRQAVGYAVPVLFPLDLIFMGCLGGFLAIASSALLNHGGASRWWVAASLFFPVAYVVIDFVEDVLLAWMLLAPKWIETLIGAAKAMTIMKFGTCFLAIAQTVVIAAVVLR